MRWESSCQLIKGRLPLKVVGCFPKYSASRNCSQRFTFSTFCHVAALFRGERGPLFSWGFCWQCPMVTTSKKFVWNVCKFIKNRKQKSTISTAQYFVQAPMTPIIASSLFEYDATSLAFLVWGSFSRSFKTKATVFSGTFNAAEMFCTLSQICAAIQSCLGGLQTIPWTSWLGLCC